MERGEERRTDFRSDFWRQMYRNQRFSSSWIFEGMAFVVFSCKQRARRERVGDELGKNLW